MRTSPRLLVAGLLALSAAGCPGCDTTKIFRGDPDDATSSTGEFTRSPTPLESADLDSLWQASEQVLRMEGYQIDSTRTHFDQREMITHWDAYLAPNRFEGKRHRAVVKFEDAGGGAWTVAVVVQMQRNIDINNPSNPAQANWEDMAPATTRAGVILFKIESGFREPGGGDNAKKTRTL